MGQGTIKFLLFGKINLGQKSPGNVIFIMAMKLSSCRTKMRAEFGHDKESETTVGEVINGKITL